MDSLRENPTEFIKINRLMLRSHQRFRWKKHNVTAEEVKWIILSSNDDKKIESMDSIEPYLYRINEEIINKKNKLNVTI